MASDFASVSLRLSTNMQLWFRSTAFDILPGEEEETNPMIYGKHLATWLSGRLRAEGIIVEMLIPEDWGWCIVTRRKPFMLLVGCSNVRDFGETKPGDPKPRGDEVVWSCFVEAEVPFWSRLWRPPATEAEVSDMFSLVHRLIAAEPRNQFCGEP